MFVRRSISTALAMAKSLRDRNIGLTPTGALVKNVVDTATYVLREQPMTRDNIDEEMVVRVLENGGEDDDCQTFLVNHLTQSLNINVKLLREVAFPLIDIVNNACEESLELLENNIAKTRHVDLYIPEYLSILEDSSLVEMFKPYESSTFTTQGSVKVIPVDKMPELSEIPLTGDDELNRQLRNFLAEVGNLNGGVVQQYGEGHGLLGFVFTVLFSNARISPEFVLNEVTYKEGGPLGVWLFAFLLARYFLTNIPEDVNTTREDYESRMSAFIGYCGSKLCTLYNKYIGTKHAKHLLFDTEKGEVPTLVLHPEVMGMAQGKIPAEAIMGNYLGDSYDWSIDYLTEHGEELTARFNKRLEEYALSFDGQRQSTFISTVADTIMEFLENKRVQEFDGARVEITVGRMELVAALTSLKFGLDRKFSEELIIHVITDAVFTGTMVPVILNKMREIEKAGSFSPEYIGLIAVISVLTDSLLSSVAIERYPSDEV